MSSTSALAPALDDRIMAQSSATKHGRDFLSSSSPYAALRSPLISFRQTPEPNLFSTPTGSPLWTSKTQSSIEDLRIIDVSPLGDIGRQRANELNYPTSAHDAFDSQGSVTPARPVVIGHGVSLVACATPRTDVTSSIASPSVPAARQPQETQARSVWKQHCEAARSRQDSYRALGHYKNRLEDPRVAVTMKELWEDAMTNYGQYFATVKSLFLLSTRRRYAVAPLATCRIKPADGSVVIRKDVRMILEKGICRTEKLNLRPFHSLISFKSNDLAAIYIKILPRRPMMILFMTKYEGPVVFFFSDWIALRVILVMMQTKFIEVLHSAVAENAIGVYAIQVLKFCEDQYVENETARKQEFVAAELTCHNYASFFQHMAYPEDDNWSEDDSDREADSDAKLQTGYGKRADTAVHYASTSKRARMSEMAQENDESFSNDELMEGVDTDKSFESTIATKKQREEAILEKLKAQRAALDEKIARQVVRVQQTCESSEEIEERITRISMALSEGRSDSTMLPY